MASDRQDIARLIEASIEKGANTAEEIHRSVADLSTDVLESVGFGDKSSQESQQIQESSIGAIYQLVRDINRSVATLARDIIQEVEAHAAGDEIAASASGKSAEIAGGGDTGE